MEPSLPSIMHLSSVCVGRGASRSLEHPMSVNHDAHANRMVRFMAISWQSLVRLNRIVDQYAQRVPSLMDASLSLPDAQECLCLVVGEPRADRARPGDREEARGEFGRDELDARGRSTRHLHRVAITRGHGHGLGGRGGIVGGDAAGARAVAHRTVCADILGATARDLADHLVTPHHHARIRSHRGRTGLR